jgi:tetratricopeptide (TPR) repeat protein
LTVWALVLWSLVVVPQADSLAALWEAATRAPRDADVQNALGEALERLGALDAAVEAYRLAVAARPGFRRASNNLILALVKAGRGPEAVERARAEADAAPDDPERRFALGLAQSEQDAEAAIASFRRVLEIAPQHALARYNLALALKRVDRLADAIQELEKVIATRPRAEAHYTLGVIYMHRGELERAAAALRGAIAAEPAHADAYYTLGALLHGQRDHNGAAAALRRAIALRPDLAGAHYTLGRVLQATGDAGEAERRFAEAERLRQRGEREREARVWTAVGAARLSSGDAAAAIEDFRRAIAAFDAYAPAHYQLGLALLRTGSPEAARAAFARARELNPSLVPPTAR